MRGVGGQGRLQFLNSFGGRSPSLVFGVTYTADCNKQRKRWNDGYFLVDLRTGRARLCDQDARELDRQTWPDVRLDELFDSVRSVKPFLPEFIEDGVNTKFGRYLVCFDSDQIEPDRRSDFKVNFRCVTAGRLGLDEAGGMMQQNQAGQARLPPPIAPQSCELPPPVSSAAVFPYSDLPPLPPALPPRSVPQAAGLPPPSVPQHEDLPPTSDECSDTPLTEKIPESPPVTDLPPPVENHLPPLPSRLPDPVPVVEKAEIEAAQRDYPSYLTDQGGDHGLPLALVTGLQSGVSTTCSAIFSGQRAGIEQKFSISSTLPAQKAEVGRLQNHQGLTYPSVVARRGQSLHLRRIVLPAFFVSRNEHYDYLFSALQSQAACDILDALSGDRRGRYTRPFEGTLARSTKGDAGRVEFRLAADRLTNAFRQGDFLLVAQNKNMQGGGGSWLFLATFKIPYVDQSGRTTIVPITAVPHYVAQGHRQLSKQQKGSEDTQCYFYWFPETASFTNISYALNRQRVSQSRLANAIACGALHSVASGPEQSFFGSTALLSETEAERAVEHVGQRYRLTPDQVNVLRAVSKWYTDPACSPVIIIHGVFGAGKTTTLSAAAELLLRLAVLADERSAADLDNFGVAISSMTNKAVDTLMLKIQKELDERIAARFPAPLCRIASTPEKTERELLPISLTTQSAQAKLKEALLASGLTAEVAPGDLGLAAVLGVTCTGVASMRSIIRRVQDEERPIQVLILDEASQIPECFSQLVLSETGAQRLLLVGDPYQLPPLYSVPSFNRTLFDRVCPSLEVDLMDLSRLYPLAHRQMFTIVRLLEQYRCHPAIADFCSRSFYCNRLRSAQSTYARAPLVPLAPISLITLRGQASGLKSSEEVRECVRTVMSLKALGAREQDIGVICLYQEQTALVQSALSAQSAHIHVGTVDSFQGGERPIIIVLTTRGVATEFTDDPRRVNVALSRAQLHLIVLSSEGLLATPGIWQQLSDYARHSPWGNVIDAEQSLEWSGKYEYVEGDQLPAEIPLVALNRDEVKLLVRGEVAAEKPVERDVAALSHGELREYLLRNVLFVGNNVPNPEFSVSIDRSGIAGTSAEPSIIQDTSLPLQDCSYTLENEEGDAPEIIERTEAARPKTPSPPPLGDITPIPFDFTFKPLNYRSSLNNIIQYRRYPMAFSQVPSAAEIEKFFNQNRDLM